MPEASTTTATPRVEEVGVSPRLAGGLCGSRRPTPRGKIKRLLASPPQGRVARGSDLNDAHFTLYRLILSINNFISGMHFPGMEEKEYY